MKKQILNTALIILMIIGVGACKEKKNENEVSNEETKTVLAPAIYNVDVSNSEILWKGSKPTGSHNGSINLKSGLIEVSDGAIATGQFNIDMNTITDLDLEGGMKENLESHLKGTVEGKEGDFFNVTKYPLASFTIIKVSEEEGNTMINGMLTIKDKTNPVSFPVTVTSENDTLTLKSETFTIDRTKWGVNYGSKSIFDNLGDKFISDDIELSISVVANKN